jgi:hypothetical protein
MNERPVVHVLFTGGAISMRRDPLTGGGADRGQSRR